MRESRGWPAVRVDAVVPLYNERTVLGASITKLHGHLAARCRYHWRIVIADNGSTDGTAEVGESLHSRLDRVELLRVGAKGRGRASRAAWLCSRADVVSYMDVDLSTELAFGTGVDAQCGFKAISRAAADRLLPQVADDEWFLDTELLIRAERSGCRIEQVPVYWTDDHSSYVRIVHTAVEDLKGIWRLKREEF